MNREQLREKISEISNSEFPLIDFFNDISRNKDPRYDKERAYEDIEKIYNVFMYYCEKSEKFEKALNIIRNRMKLFPYHVEKFGLYQLEIYSFEKLFYITKEEYELLKEVYHYE